MLKKIKCLLKSLFVLGFSVSSVSAVSVESGDGTKFTLGGFVNGMYSYLDNAANAVYKPSSAKRQTSIKDTKARGGFRDEATRLRFQVDKEVGEKKVTGRIEFEFDGKRKNSERGYLDYRIAFIDIKFNDKLSLLLGRNWEIFGNTDPYLGPYTDYIRTWTWGQGHASGDTANQVRVTYKLNDNTTVQGSIGDRGSDREQTVDGDFNQQPRLSSGISYSKGKNSLAFTWFYQRRTISRPDLFNNESVIPLSKDLPDKLAAVNGSDVFYLDPKEGVKKNDNVLDCPTDQGYTKVGNVCKKKRSLFYDGTFNEAYYLYYPEAGVDKMGSDYDSIGYSFIDEYEINDKHKFSIGFQTGVNMNYIYAGNDNPQRYSILEDVNASLLGQYSKIQELLNKPIYEGSSLKGKDVLGGTYQTKSIKNYNIFFRTHHKLTDKLNFITWIGQSKVINAKDLKPNNGNNGTDAAASLARANHLAYSGASGGVWVENNLFKYTFEYTPFKGEIDNLKFFAVHSHLQTTYANTEVQNNSTLAAILPYMGKDYKDDNKKEIIENARNKAFEESLRKKAGKTAIANNITLGAVYNF